MSDTPHEGEAPEARGTRVWRGFRKPRGPRLDPDAARRQGLITHLAFSALGGRDQAILFLNGSDDAIGGTPLEIATASGAGYQQVEELIRQLIGPDNKA